jgi:lactoylglutathione lyase
VAERARLVGINHVAIEVGDLDAALALYARLFDYDLRGRIRGMAFIDIGDQFLAVSEGRTQAPDDARHFGLVVDDVDAFERALQAEGIAYTRSARTGSIDFRDPWGTLFQVVAYRDVQFERTEGVRRKLGIAGIEKSEAARREIAERGLGDESGGR